MPEGHTIHRLAREHRRLFGGAPVAVSSPQGRFAAGAALLDGLVLTRTDAHGKHLFHGYGGTARWPERWLHVHLGLYGKFTTGVVPAPAPVGQVRLRLVNGEHCADLRGPIACEVLTPGEKAALHGRLGADPLRPDADPSAAWDRISRSRTPIGLLLMDQSVVAGVGNVYRAEVLFRHGVDPHRPGLSLDRACWDALWADLVALLRAGVRAGRIVTTRPEHRDRRTGTPSREDAHYVYRRTGLPCRVCGTPVRTEEMATRNLYRCPVCQG
ncbi:MAG TPA: DNA-formamidopyrimidine glycosylase family protein [Mycobacteriales bacterium]